MSKPCSSPSNEVCDACQTTHEYEKRKSDREIERRHYLDEMFPLFKKRVFFYCAWVLVHSNKKATRQQFYGMLTGSVIIESAQTDDHHIYDAKLMLFVSNNK